LLGGARGKKVRNFRERRTRTSAERLPAKKLRDQLLASASRKIASMLSSETIRILWKRARIGMQRQRRKSYFFPVINQDL
jgi:hypothetical protein